MVRMCMQNLAITESFVMIHRRTIPTTKIINTEAFIQLILYIFIFVGYLVSATGGILGFICFTAFLFFMVVLFAAPKLALIISGILFLPWRLD